MFERTYNGTDYEPIAEQLVRDYAKGFYDDVDEFVSLLKECPNNDFRLSPFSYVRFIKKEQ